MTPAGNAIRLQGASVQTTVSKTGAQAVRHASVSVDAGRHDSNGSLTDATRREVQDVVRAAVGPALDRVRELERSVTELRSALARIEQQSLDARAVAREPTYSAQSQSARSVPSPITVPSGDTIAKPAPAGNVATQTVPSTMQRHSSVAVEPYTVPTTLERSVSATNSVPVNDPHDLGDLGDVPWELSGSRRRAMVGWTLGTLAALVLLGTCGAAILSQLGY